MRAMTDLDTHNAVIWPKWCYSNNQTELVTPQDLVFNNNNTTQEKESKVIPLISAHPGTKARRKAPRGAGVRQGSSKNMHQDPSEVKSERSSPDPTAEVTTSATPAQNSPSPSLSPKSPASQRTRTPSFPGTPPNPAFTPPAPVPPGYDRFSPASLNGMGGLTAGSLKQMESPLNRNYSDIMRSLAAKYNNNNPNDYFSNPSNGFLRSSFPSIHHLKSGPPFLPLNPSAVPPMPATRDSEKKVDLALPSSGVTLPPGLPTPAGPPLFPTATLTSFTGFPLVDMSSTQVLLNMVRNANASVAQQSQLEHYLRGAMKRPAEASTSPLDLSSSVAVKKPKTDSTRHLSLPNVVLGIPPEEDKAMESKAQSPTTQAKPLVSPASGKGLNIPCSDRQCSTFESISHWTVDEVCSFVSSIALCSEYVESFREQRIDGSSLPLLTEEHLTSSMNMKLGPALKLLSALSRKVGSCNVCLHCDHCHSQQQERRPASTSSGQ